MEKNKRYHILKENIGFLNVVYIIRDVFTGETICEDADKEYIHQRAAYLENKMEEETKVMRLERKLEEKQEEIRVCGRRHTEKCNEIQELHEEIKDLHNLIDEEREKIAALKKREQTLELEIIKLEKVINNQEKEK